MRSFLSGFVLGFGSGVAFRALAERDFEPLKEAAKTGLGGLQKVGDALADTFGRLREAVEDVGAESRAARVERKPSPRVVRPKVELRVDRTDKKNPRRPRRTAGRELHS